MYRDPEFTASVEKNLHRSDTDIALDKSLPHAREIASRVKYLQKARAKLPSFYRARCIVPPRAYEQATSEAAALEKVYRGRLCIDLTCGLGVDAWALSRGFEKVVALERDPVLAEVARYNFALLGPGNIEVVNSSAEEYLAENPLLRADMVYADPDRRTAAGRRVAALEDCSPDILSLMPLLGKVTDKVVIKLSPLFDVHEAIRVFGPEVKVTAISEHGECKELLVETGTGPARIAARITGEGEMEFTYSGLPGRGADAVIWDAHYLAVPDVALVKSGIAGPYYRQLGWVMPTPHGFVFGREPVPGFASRIFRIVRMEKYNPKRIKKILAEEGITRLNILMRDFPTPVEKAAAELGVGQGGGRWAALATAAGRRIFMLLEPQVQ